MEELRKFSKVFQKQNLWRKERVFFVILLQTDYNYITQIILKHIILVHDV